MLEQERDARSILMVVECDVDGEKRVHNKLLLTQFSFHYSSHCYTFFSPSVTNFSHHHDDSLKSRCDRHDEEEVAEIETFIDCVDSRLGGNFRKQSEE